MGYHLLLHCKYSDTFLYTYVLNYIVTSVFHSHVNIGGRSLTHFTPKPFPTYYSMYNVLQFYANVNLTMYMPPSVTHHRIAHVCDQLYYQSWMSY